MNAARLPSQTHSCLLHAHSESSSSYQSCFVKKKPDATQYAYTSVWVAQKVGGKYADPEMGMVALPSSTATAGALESTSGGGRGKRLHVAGDSSPTAVLSALLRARGHRRQRHAQPRRRRTQVVGRRGGGLEPR